MTATQLKPRPHPAKFSPAILDAINGVLGREAEARDQRLKVLDPFAGIGGIHTLDKASVYRTVGVEIEPEWAGQHPQTIIGDATNLPFADDSFDAVVTSPCYGNRMADKYDGRDGSKRITYRIQLGRMPSERSAAVMPFHTDAYKELHNKAWREAMRVAPFLIVNVSDFIRKWEKVEVSQWHANILEYMGWEIEDWCEIPTPRMRMGQNHDLRVDAEDLIVCRRP